MLKLMELEAAAAALAKSKFVAAAVRALRIDYRERERAGQLGSEYLVRRRVGAEREREPKSITSETRCAALRESR